MMYEAAIAIRVALTGPGADLGAAIDDVASQLALIDSQTPELLDYAVSSDADDNTALFEITVDAGDEMEALAAAVSWVRAAIHATGGNTPGWAVDSVGTVSIEPLAAHAG